MSTNFNISESKILKGVKIITPSISSDKRGNIWTSFLREEIDLLLPNGLSFKHDKFSKSIQGVLRGIHGDSKSWKLVTTVFGEMIQVVVDCRKDSETYMKYEKFIINSDNPTSILIPPNMGNAYYVKSDSLLYHYKLAYSGGYIDSDEQFSLNWNDKRLGIDWNINDPILSNRDAC